MFGLSKKEKFVKAITTGNVGEVQAAIRENPDWLSREFKWASFYTKNSPLGCAARTGQLEVVKALLDLGANINKKNEACGSTPLHAAVYGQHLEILKYLLDRGANKYLVNKKIQTPYDLAVFERKIDLVMEFQDRLQWKKDAAREKTFESINQKFDDIEENLEEIKVGVDQLKEQVEKRRAGIWSLDTKSQVRFEQDVGDFKLTDVFNFEMRERTTLWKDEKSFTSKTKSFDVFTDKTPLEKALDQLTALGGTAARHAIYAAPRDKRPL